MSRSAQLSGIRPAARKAAVIGRPPQRPLRYLFASIGALAVDLAGFLALLLAGAPAAIASALGYAVGIAAHWQLSSRRVFTESAAPGGPQRQRQKALFIASALLGLGLTTIVVGIGAASGLDPRLAKLAAVAASFAATWQMRERLVFRS